MRKVMMVLTALGMGGCLMGCVLVVEKDADIGIEFTSGIKAYQHAPDGGSKLEGDLLPWVRDEIKARREAEMILRAATAAEDDG